MYLCLATPMITVIIRVGVIIVVAHIGVMTVGVITVIVSVAVITVAVSALSSLPLYLSLSALSSSM